MQGFHIMGIVIDVILLAVFVLILLIGKKRGFIKAITGLACVALSSLSAWLFSSPLAAFFKDRFMGFFTEKIRNRLQDSIAQKTNDEFFASVPESISSLTQRFGLDGTAISEKYASLQQSGEDAVTSMAGYIAEPIVTAVSNAVAMLLIFTVAMVVFHLLLHALNLVAKLPVLKTINAGGGLIVGAVYGVAIVYMLCVALTVFGPMLAVSHPDTVSMDWLNHSLIYQFFSSWIIK